MTSFLVSDCIEITLTGIVPTKVSLVVKQDILYLENLLALCDSDHSSLDVLTPVKKIQI